MACFQSCFHNNLCSLWFFPSKIHPLKWGVLAKQAFICGPWWSVTESLSDVFVFFFPNFDGKKDAKMDDAGDGHFLIPGANDGAKTDASDWKPERCQDSDPPEN